MNKVKPLSIDEAMSHMPSRRVDTLTEQVNAAIIHAAKLDKCEARVDFLGRIEGEFLKLSTAGQRVKEMFEEVGYTFHDVYDIRQFVDIGLMICWSEPPK